MRWLGVACLIGSAVFAGFGLDAKARMDQWREDYQRALQPLAVVPLDQSRTIFLTIPEDPQFRRIVRGIYRVKYAIELTVAVPEKFQSGSPEIRILRNGLPVELCSPVGGGSAADRLGFEAEPGDQVELQIAPFDSATAVIRPVWRPMKVLPGFEHSVDVVANVFGAFISFIAGLVFIGLAGRRPGIQT